MTTADTRHDQRAIKLVRDRLRWHCGKNAPRSQVILAMASAGSWCDLSESETAQVLGYFDADPEPVEGKDYYLPTPPSLRVPQSRPAEPVTHADVPREEWDAR